MKKAKRLLSVLLAAAMTVAMFILPTFAADTTTYKVTVDNATADHYLRSLSGVCR
jgi:hypothetical protein